MGVEIKHDICQEPRVAAKRKTVLGKLKEREVFTVIWSHPMVVIFRLSLVCGEVDMECQ